MTLRPCLRLLVLAAGLFVWARRCVGPLKRPSASVRIRELLRGAAPIGASQLLRVVALGSDLVLLGLLVSFQQVGLYAGAYRVFTVGVSLATAYFMVLLPRLARRTGASVLFAFTERLPRGAGYRLHFLPAPEAIADEDLHVACAALNQGVEDCVRLAFAQYQWTYKRWG